MATKEAQARNAKSQQLGGLISGLETKMNELRSTTKRQLEMLLSVSEGLYDEVDKLCRKAPVESVTDLALQQINDVIRETKQLATQDPYVQRLTEFVPAGDNPELRDALMVLRQIRQGLQRFASHLTSEIERIEARRNEARFVSLCVTLHLRGESTTEANLRKYRYGDHVYSRWMTNDGANIFSLTFFDQTDLARYFT